MLGSLFAGHFVANNYEGHRHQLFDIRKHHNCSAYLSVDFVLCAILLVPRDLVDSVAKRIYGHHAALWIITYSHRSLLKQPSAKLPATAWMPAQSEFARRHRGDRGVSTLDGAATIPIR